jgi:hypothetical protein
MSSVPRVDDDAEVTASIALELTSETSPVPHPAIVEGEAMNQSAKMADPIIQTAP